MLRAIWLRTAASAWRPPRPSITTRPHISREPFLQFVQSAGRRTRRGLTVQARCRPTRVRRARSVEPSQPALLRDRHTRGLGRSPVPPVPSGTCAGSGWSRSCGSGATMPDAAVLPKATTSRGQAEARALDHSLVRGVAWTAAAKWASQALSWVSWLIVARLLTPEDYGLVGMAAIYLGLITLLSEFGLGTAALAIRELSLEQIHRLNGLAVLCGLARLL